MLSFETISIWLKISKEFTENFVYKVRQKSSKTCKVLILYGMSMSTTDYNKCSDNEQGLWRKALLNLAPKRLAHETTDQKRM